MKQAQIFFKDGSRELIDPVDTARETADAIYIGIRGYEYAFMKSAFHHIDYIEIDERGIQIETSDKAVLERVTEMCEESCSPDQLETWENLCKYLIETRHLTIE
ncbi:MAG: hypothetical protein ACYC36_06220 [Bellilinea sp.]